MCSIPCCHVPGCAIPPHSPKAFFCRMHWHMLPEGQKRRIVRYYVHSRPLGKQPNAYHAATQKAVELLINRRTA